MNGIKTIVATCLLAPALALTAQAQTSTPSSTAEQNVSYQIQEDDPGTINDVWIHLQPLAPEVGAQNFILGYGVQANIKPASRVSLKLAGRGSYGLRMDVSRHNGTSNEALYYLNNGERKFARTEQSNAMVPFGSLEGIATLRLRNKVVTNQAKVVITSAKRLLEGPQVADHILVTSSQQRAWGLRLGGLLYQTTTDVTTAMFRQNVSLTGSDGSRITKDGYTVMPGGQTSTNKNFLFASLKSAGVAVGGSFTSVRNLAIRADRYGTLANNVIFTAYADVLVSPWTSLDDVVIQRGQPGAITYSTAPLTINTVGYRVGADWMYNQDLFISWGGEIGVRPGLAGRGFYMVAKIGLPVASLRFRGPVMSTNTSPNAAPKE